MLNYLEALVSPAVAGDPEAVGRLLTTIRPLVVQYCRVRIGRAEQSLARADDVAQEACLAVLTALPRYRSQGRPFLAFVYGITAHKVADAQRVRGRDQRESAPMSDAERDQTTANIDQMLSGLTPRQRDILILRIVIGLSAEETAEAVGSTPGAVRVAQHRALARLRKTTNLNTTNR
ncbi:RNA polymerase sigma factor ShbA [Kibdelosporangium philippinense]|uniref:RNA polymerase sigma factor ShbA n=1 Tax=Kibdelosporangium philippinense TaxID=211113 RepID=A0ABS8ZVW1_9PSEU|nr:RNA polymerase sigma factor ShbA [Kibdelosporangium philippinense]MCE7009987.1 RNA polymerase sigma factor ShbA [Kibdelosporangium philippinense]